MVQSVKFRGYKFKADMEDGIITLMVAENPFDPRTFEGQQIDFGGTTYQIHRAIDPYRPPHAPEGHTNAGKFVELTVTEPGKKRPAELPESNVVQSPPEPEPRVVNPTTDGPRVFKA